MQIELENVTISYPDEDTGVDRRVIIFDDGEYLQLNFHDNANSPCGGEMTLNKQQVGILRDVLDLMLKNNLVE